MTLKDLYSKNKFIEIVLKDNQIILQKELKLKKGRTIKLSDRERFSTNTFYYMTEILSKMETINYYLAFLNSYPKTKLWDKTFSRVDYVKYHTESYLNNITGIFDRCLLLVNFLYDLGFQDKHVRYQLIISNKHIIKEPILGVLKSFNKTLKNIRLLRAFTQHRGRFSDKELDEIGRYEFITRASKKITKKEKNYLINIAKLKMRSYLSKKKKETKEINTAIIESCDKLLTILVGKYKKRLNELNIKNKENQT